MILLPPPLPPPSPWASYANLKKMTDKEILVEKGSIVSWWGEVEVGAFEDDLKKVVASSNEFPLYASKEIKYLCTTYTIQNIA
jgi:hypothetical protein